MITKRDKTFTYLLNQIIEKRGHSLPTEGNLPQRCFKIEFNIKGNKKDGYVAKGNYRIRQTLFEDVIAIYYNEENEKFVPHAITMSDYLSEKREFRLKNLLDGKVTIPTTKRDINLGEILDLKLGQRVTLKLFSGYDTHSSIAKVVKITPKGFKIENSLYGTIQLRKDGTFGGGYVKEEVMTVEDLIKEEEQLTFDRMYR